MVDDIKTNKEDGTFQTATPANPTLPTPEQLAQSAFQKDNPNNGEEKRFHFTKKQKIIFIVVVFLLIVGGTVAVFASRKKPVEPATQQVIEEPVKTTEASKLSGLQVKPEVNKRVVTGVMIENSPDARPQAGLNQADIVFEAVAEGGITRFLALFHDHQPNYIGPVRSVRPYYLEWVTPFDAPLAHAGGSAEALHQLRAEKLKDLEAFQNAEAYQRISSRYAPHNLYTSIEKLNALEKKKGWTKSEFTSWPRYETENKALTPSAKHITLNISSTLYNVVYRYDVKTNSYRRYMAGKPHIDEKSGKQITPKVVVVLIMKKGLNGKYTTYKSRGSGTMFVFQNGKQIKGRWEKTSRHSQFKFVDSEGQTLKLNPGQTWVTVLGSTNEVKVSKL